MGVSQLAAITAMGLLLIAVLLRVFARPLTLALKLAVNTALGFFALAALRLLSPWLGISLGCNLFNAAVLGVLGLPGFFLLLLLKWVLLA